MDEDHLKFRAAVEMEVAGEWTWTEESGESGCRRERH